MKARTAILVLASFLCGLAAGPAGIKGPDHPLAFVLIYLSGYLMAAINWRRS